MRTDWRKTHGVLALLGWVFVLTASNASAEVTRWEITSRGPYADGREFGTAGAYERIVGKVYYALDPAAKANQDIVDLTRAPQNAQRKVEFWSDLVILTPVDPAKGNRSLFYDVNNRGNKTALGFFNGGDPGDGFLMRQGFTLVWNGWDGELLPGGDRLRLSPPIATDGENKITGLVRCEIVPGSAMTRTVINWDNHGAYRPTEKGLKEVTLTVRERPDDPRQPIARDQFTMHVTEVSSDSLTQLPKVELEYPAGLKPGLIYELIYEAQDPLVHGVCFASVRDLISALKHGGGAEYPFGLTGAPGSTGPLVSACHKAGGFCVSSSSRDLTRTNRAGSCSRA